MKQTELLLIRKMETDAISSSELKYRSLPTNCRGFLAPEMQGTVPSASIGTHSLLNSHGLVPSPRKGLWEIHIYI